MHDIQFHFGNWLNCLTLDSFGCKVVWPPSFAGLLPSSSEPCRFAAVCSSSHQKPNPNQTFSLVIHLQTKTYSTTLTSSFTTAFKTFLHRLLTFHPCQSCLRLRLQKVSFELLCTKAIPAEKASAYRWSSKPATNVYIRHFFIAAQRDN